MKRKEFLKSLGLLALTPYTMSLTSLEKATRKFETTEKMPVLFAGHGNPINAISENNFTRGWANMVKDIPTPNAILCVSAHWETRGTQVTAMEKPKTIHDFGGGFPKQLFKLEYPSPGAPEYANKVQEQITKTNVEADYSWGLDHGTWSVLVKMFPEANIPVFQLSLDHTKPAQYHYELAQQLAPLRKKGVLIMGSGNIVHNLRKADFSNKTEPYDWAVEFDQQSKELIKAGDHQKLINYEKLGKAARLSIPTPDHYLPMLYALALQEKEEELTFYNEAMVFKSGSMRSFKIT